MVLLLLAWGERGLSYVVAGRPTAASASEAAQALSHWLADHDTECDLAIVDLFLREGSGLGVMAGCRNRALRQKVVVLTNYATPEIRKRASELGVNAVFDKSSELEQLFA